MIFFSKTNLVDTASTAEEGYHKYLDLSSDLHKVSPVARYRLPLTECVMEKHETLEMIMNRAQKIAAKEVSEMYLRFSRYYSVDLCGKSYVVCILSEIVTSGCN